MADPNSFAVLKSITEHPVYGPEFIREFEQIKAQNLGANLTPEQMEDAANRVVMRHKSEIFQALAVAEGRAPDTSKLPRSYVAQLAARDVTNDDVAEIARRLYPDLTPAQALAKWTQKASRMKDIDLNSGAEYQQGGHYVPGRDTPLESDV